MGPGAVIRRRTVLGAAAGLPVLGACTREAEARWSGGWVGSHPERGHAWRDGRLAATAAAEPARRVAVAIVGAGIAGLSAARGLQRAGIDDYAVFDLEDAAGGNSRGHAVAGLPCPLGAHYLPLPSPDDEALVAWLHEIGLAHSRGGRIVYDERHLCHSPQERLFADGRWHEGLLPQPAAPGAAAAALAAYRRFAADVATVSRELAFRIPTTAAPWTSGHAALDAQAFAGWLDARGHRDASLRWYLDYCCRDDYGASAEMVSAWAGLQYFASRHGFQAPGDADQQPEAVLTWPQGNAWLADKLAAGIGERLHCAHVVTRITTGRHELALDVWDAAAQRPQRWVARQVVVAVPLFVAARLFDAPDPALRTAAQAVPHAPWLVANLLLEQPLLPRPGAPPAWDNVSLGSTGLGYVDARHQSLSPDAAVSGPQLLTYYRALGGRSPQELKTQRAALLSGSWRDWTQAVLDDLAATHPDLPSQLRRADLVRQGHAMAIPMPGVRGHPALQALATPRDRVSFAHADLSAYSIFEEAFHRGLQAAARLGNKG